MKANDRRQTEAYIRKLTGKLTPAEKKIHEEQERQNFNRNAAIEAWWAGSDTYVDYDGRVVKIEHKE